MSEPLLPPCTDGARERDDPMLGTAPPGRRWVLVERSGRWPARGFADTDVEVGVRRAVVRAAQEAGARILLVRRPGRQDGSAPRCWAVLEHEDSGDYRQTWGSWEQDRDLLQITEALRAPGTPGLPPVLLVCAHGLHDTCCAVRGRPVAAALADRWPELVWECSHVGGDRFAANVVVAPDGVYYGGLDAGSAVEVVTDHLAGRVTATHLRGYTTLSIPEQVAVVGALRELGPAGRHDLEVLGHTLPENGTGPGGVQRVRLRSRSHAAEITVELSAERAPAAQLTCRAASPARALVHQVTSVRVDRLP
ncbi:sucrase ferredoxin [Auraticoccus monumenti]|uniref:Sucrase/ferredoxin-like n=1 Tax=Auraticoccus monumenti TaxID=675864 RepID=A0A1G7DXK7_9ACTN|nr:sucrase ferredoxin [Auraticoccus monumenti]SDE56173.1 hypothetical protein SAMN04489747_3751 [Auraticoccus monumenti]